MIGNTQSDVKTSFLHRLRMLSIAVTEVINIWDDYYLVQSNDILFMSLANHNTVAAKCDVAGCENDAERSFNIKQVAKSQITLKSNDLRQVHLCKEHYKEYKKQTKTDREIDAIYD